MDVGDRRFRCRLISIACMAMGCGIGDRKTATFQLDVEDSPLIDTDRIRVCVQDTLIHETAVGDGRLAIPGIPTEGPIRVVISALDESMSVGGTDLVMLDRKQSWTTTPWVVCEATCEPCRLDQAETKNNPNNAGLLAIHFLH